MWGGSSVITPRNNSEHKRTKPIEQTEGYTRTRSMCPFIFLPVLLIPMLYSVQSRPSEASLVRRQALATRFSLPESTFTPLAALLVLRAGFSREHLCA